MTKKISVTGIVTGVLYFISVGAFLITQSEIALTIWELMTVISAPVVMFVVLRLCDLVSDEAIYKKAALAFMSCTCALTSIAHIVNITVTRPLMSKGVDVPTYFQIGYWPSVEMAIDYSAWGFFTGLAFLCIGLATKNKNKLFQQIKATSLICGSLCLVGFFGTIFINENIWYTAPLGYGFGTIILCLQMFHLED